MDVLRVDCLEHLWVVQMDDLKDDYLEHSWVVQMDMRMVHCSDY
jgi:hypothetical protein